MQCLYFCHFCWKRCIVVMLIVTDFTSTTEYSWFLHNKYRNVFCWNLRNFLLANVRHHKVVYFKTNNCKKWKKTYQYDFTAFYKIYIDYETFKFWFNGGSLTLMCLHTKVPGFCFSLVPPSLVSKRPSSINRLCISTLGWNCIYKWTTLHVYLMTVECFFAVSGFLKHRNKKQDVLLFRLWR